MDRPSCSVFIAMSLDGFIARKDGSIDWLSKVEVAGEDYGYQSFFESVDALVIGRGTYDVALKFDAWPYGTKRCVVLSNRPCSSLHGEELHRGDPRPLLARLQQEGARRVYVDGGRVISQFFELGLLDEVTVSVVPILLGSGIRLFSEATHETQLRLLSSESFNSGLVQLRYAVV